MGNPFTMSDVPAATPLAPPSQGGETARNEKGMNQVTRQDQLFASPASPDRN